MRYSPGVQTVLFVFPLFYLALALTMTAATILTIQQLSETERYRRQLSSAFPGRPYSG